MQRACARLATINMGMAKRGRLLLVSTRINSAMPKICAWPVIITKNMSETRDKKNKTKKLFTLEDSQ